MKRVCVFTGSRPGAKPEYLEGAKALGRLFASSGIGLVYGGASVGAMRAIADSVLEAGGEAIGVIPRTLVDKEVAHTGLTKLHVVETMHERKAMMADLADGFIALPGGFGTLDELFEILTWSQLGLHAKPIALLDVAGFWGPLAGFLEHIVREGFIPEDQLGLLLVDRDPRVLIERMRAWKVPALGKKWIDKKDL